MDVSSETAALGYATLWGVTRAASHVLMADEMTDKPALGARKKRLKAADARPAADVRTVAEICAALGYDPITSIITAVQTGDLSDADKVRTALGLAEYIHPKLGRLEHTGKGGGPVQHQHQVIERRIIDPKH